MSNITLPVAMGLLIAVFSAAVGAGTSLHRFEERRGVLDDRDRKLVAEGLGGAVGFLGGSVLNQRASPMSVRVYCRSYPFHQQEVSMGLDPKSAINAAKDIAAHAVEKAADIVEDAGHIVKGDIAGGASAIVQDATDIATHAVDKAKEVISGKSE